MSPLRAAPLRPFEIAPLRVLKGSDLRAEHLRSGARRVYRGRAVIQSLADQADPRRAEVLALVAAIASGTLRGQHFCFESAALVWGCDAIAVGRGVDLNQSSSQHRGADARVRRHHSAIPADQCAEIDGIPVTNLARSVVDCARTLSTRRALVIADSASRNGLVHSDVARTLESLGGRRGVRQARDLLELMDGGAASPGETLTRLALIGEGLPRPSTQVQIMTGVGLRYADLGWRELRVVVEFDGRVKYSGRWTADPVEALIDEKRRQEAIEDAGWVVVRAMWEDLRTPALLADRVRAAATRARRQGLGRG